MFLGTVFAETLCASEFFSSVPEALFFPRYSQTTGRFGHEGWEGVGADPIPTTRCHVSLSPYGILRTQHVGRKTPKLSFLMLCEQ